jgi:hypothetical protein
VNHRVTSPRVPTSYPDQLPANSGAFQAVWPVLPPRKADTEAPRATLPLDEIEIPAFLSKQVVCADQLLSGQTLKAPLLE